MFEIRFVERKKNGCLLTKEEDNDEWMIKFGVFFVINDKKKEKKNAQSWCYKKYNQS
jgi:hypothetical protein